MHISSSFFNYTLASQFNTSLTTTMASDSAAATALTASRSFRRLRSDNLNALRLRRVFDLFDRNGDGVITHAELALALERLGLGAADAAGLADLRDAVAAYIPRGASGLSFADFEALHRELGDALLGGGADADAGGGEEEDGDMREAFRVFDENGDGFISAAELQAVLARMGLPEAGSMAKVRGMIAAADTDSDGRIDFAEFKRMMQGVATV